MKNTFGLLISSLALAGLLFTACEEEEMLMTDVPESVSSAFNEKFPEAADTEWEQKDNIWEAEFELNDQEMEAEFDEAGQWLETEMEIAPASLPDEVLQSIQTNYADFDIREARMLERPEFSGYKVEISKGLEEKEIIFDQAGQVVEETEE